MAKKLYEEASVQDIANAIREKTGGAETYKIAQMGNAVRGITTGDQIAHADIPSYVKAEALAVADEVTTKVIQILLVLLARQILAVAAVEQAIIMRTAPQQSALPVRVVLV